MSTSPGRRPGAGPRRGPPGRPRHHRLHVRHDGAPKGAVLSHGNLLASSESVRLAWRWTGDDRLVLALPLFHIHGLGVGLHGTLLAGASAVLLPRFDPDAVLDAVAAHDATLFFGVPTMYARLAARPGSAELGPAPPVRVGLGAARRRRSSTGWPTAAASGSSSATA